MIRRLYPAAVLLTLTLAPLALPAQQQPRETMVLFVPILGSEGVQAVSDTVATRAIQILDTLAAARDLRFRNPLDVMKALRISGYPDALKLASEVTQLSPLMAVETSLTLAAEVIPGGYRIVPTLYRWDEEFMIARTWPAIEGATATALAATLAASVATESTVRAPR